MAFDIPAHEILLLVSLLLLKHFLCDFVLQTDYQVRWKGVYGHVGGVIHAGAHAVGTAIVLIPFSLGGAALGLGAGTIAAICVAEFVIHYHVDFVKERVTRANGWGPAQRLFWIALGADQFVHAQTYVAIALWAAVAAS